MPPPQAAACLGPHRACGMPVVLRRPSHRGYTVPAPCRAPQDGHSGHSRQEREEAHQALPAPSERPQDRRQGASAAAGGAKAPRDHSCKPPPPLLLPLFSPAAASASSFLQESWRRPKGIDSRVRRKFKGCGIIMPNIGYGTNKKTRHVLPNGASSWLPRYAAKFTPCAFVQACAVCIACVYVLQQFERV